MPVTLENRESSFELRLQTYALINIEHIDLDQFFDDAVVHFIDKQASLINSNHLMKTYAVFVGEFKKKVTTSGGQIEEIKQILYIGCGAQLMDLDTDIYEWYIEYICNNVKNSVEDFEINGSGWTLSAIIELVIYNNSYEPLRGSSYLVLPKYIASKHAVINVRNHDQMCFKWAVLSARHVVTKDAQRVSKYLEFADEMNFDSIRFPVSLHQIKQFEKNNPTISINVYIYDTVSKSKVIPIRLTRACEPGNLGLEIPGKSSSIDISRIPGNSAEYPVLKNNYVC